MKLYHYRGLNNEKVPKDVTHVIVDDSVTVIEGRAFYECKHLVYVIMGDNVKRIEQRAFWWCPALRFIRLSKTLEFIGWGAFRYCRSLEALFLPSTVKYIQAFAFDGCRLLRLIILPDDIDLRNIGERIIHKTGIHRIAETAGVAYGNTADEIAVVVRVAGQRDDNFAENNHQMHEWLVHHMDDSPFHKLCYNPSITTKDINDYLIEHGNDSALAIDTIHGMTPLHILSMNPHAPPDAIAALLNSNMEAIMCLDSQQKTPLEYARDYNVDGLIPMIAVLCNHRNSPTILVGANMNVDKGTKRRRIEIAQDEKEKKPFVPAISLAVLYLTLLLLCSAMSHVSHNNNISP